MAKRRVVRTRQDGDGDITHVMFQGNQRFTPLEVAIPIADRGEIERIHVVRREGVKTHLRTNADAQIRNNLDEMASILSLILNVIYDRDEKSWRRTVALFEEAIYALMISQYENIKDEIKKLNGGPKKAFAEFYSNYNIRPLDSFSKVLVTLCVAITILSAAMLAASYLDFNFNINWKSEDSTEPNG